MDRLRPGEVFPFALVRLDDGRAGGRTPEPCLAVRVEHGGWAGLLRAVSTTAKVRRVLPPIRVATLGT